MFRLTLVFCLLVTLASSESQARIGESRSVIERRLFSSGGIVYRDDDIELARQRGKPYLQFLELMPDSFDLRIYFKTEDGREPSSSELNAKRMGPGWDLHVVYVSGKSVLEYYERSQALTQFEFNQLLAVHAGGSYWKKLAKGDKKEPSAFGYEMERADGTARARRMGGNGLLLVDAKFDTKLAEMNEADKQEKAPVSVQGF